MLSTKQAARLLETTTRQVLRYIHAGELEAEQLGDGPTAPWMIHSASAEQLRTRRLADPPRRGRRPNATATVREGQT